MTLNTGPWLPRPLPELQKLSKRGAYAGGAEAQKS